MWKELSLPLHSLLLLLSTRFFCDFILVIRIPRTSRTDGHSHFSAHLNTYVNDDRTFQLRTGQCNLPNSRLSVIFVGYIKPQSKVGLFLFGKLERKWKIPSTWLAVSMKLRQGYLKWFEKLCMSGLFWSIGSCSWGLLRNGEANIRLENECWALQAALSPHNSINSVYPLQIHPMFIM